MKSWEIETQAALSAQVLGFQSLCLLAFKFISRFKLKFLFPLEYLVNYVCNYSNQADIFIIWGTGVLLVSKLLFELMDIQISLFFLIIRQIWNLRGRRWEFSLCKITKSPVLAEFLELRKVPSYVFFSCLNNVVTRWWLMHYILVFWGFSNYGLEFRHNTKERNAKCNTSS